MPIWGLHVWGDAVAAEEATAWATPLQRARVDAHGAVFEIRLADDTAELRFVVHRAGANADIRDPAPDRSFVPADHSEVWIEQDQPDMRFSPPEG